VFIQPQCSSALGLPQLGGRLRGDGTTITSLQHLAMTTLPAGFSLKGLEAFGPEPPRIGIEGLELQGSATQQMHQRTPPKRSQGQLGAGEPASHNQDPLILWPCSCYSDGRWILSLCCSASGGWLPEMAPTQEGN
jgi:hypothetical protein